MKDVICFEVNDWDKYPKYFDEWFDHKLHKHSGARWIPELDAYAKANKLCIKIVVVDMSISLVITAPKDWVKKNIPEFEDEKWVGSCVFKYPWPWKNDYIYCQPDGLNPEEDKEYEDKRKNDLYLLHEQFTDEEIENFKPHNTFGSPSGENFLDWIEENYGAREWEDGKPYESKKES